MKHESQSDLSVISGEREASELLEGCSQADRWRQMGHRVTDGIPKDFGIRSEEATRGI